ncbi:DUF6493 family protein [Streptomyces sp. NPDC056921]|uniref:DUF7824 domain-containing protein n=1 Tax=Streptomyces sp. NPDC056921 TaxID=3345966 RepID=UPI003627862D
MKELLTAVRELRAHDVPEVLAGMDREERRAALAELKALRKEVRGWHWDKQDRVRRALLVAGAGCHTGAAGCASWIGGRDLAGWNRQPFPLVLAALADRDPKWLGDVAHRLAARPATAQTMYELISGLVKKARCPVPTTDGFVLGWAEAISMAQWHRRKKRPLVEVLRSDPYAPALLPRLFEVPELPSQMLWPDDANDPCQWATTLAALPGEGLLERSVLVDGCATRLLRGGKLSELRFFLGLLRKLELTEQEETERLADWIGMAADGSSTVAGHAQGVLTRLDGRGELTVRALADVSASVLFRTEKKLVRSQLVLLGKVLRRDTSAADELLPVVAGAFEHEDIDIQERALKLVARYLPAAGTPVREELALSAALLGPAHRTMVAEVFGGPATGTPGRQEYEELLPPVPDPQLLDPAPATLPELVEEVVTLIRSATPDVTAFERALDGLVRHAHSDQSALTDALRDALAGEWWLENEPPSQTERQLRSDAEIRLVVATLLGRVSARAVQEERASWTGTGTCVHAALNGILRARLWEAADAVLSGSTPFLLAVPTWHTGSLDPAVLVERLRACQRLGVRPGEADFAQALLRVRRGDQHGAAEAAALLGTPEGDRLAAWLRADEPLARVHRFDLEKRGREGQTVVRSSRALMASQERPFIQEEFPRSFHWLGRPQVPAHRQCYHWDDHPNQWTATLPEDAETLAAWLLPNIATGVIEEIQDTLGPLVLLTELDASAGEAVHLMVAYALGARHPEDRLSAVDALLMLATRQQLDAVLLGEQLADLLGNGLIKPSRLADSARTAAATGAYRTVLSTLTGALPGLLAREKAPRGLGDLLSVAAECVEHCGAMGGGEPIPGLAETAARGGSSQLVRQAVRLKAAWEQDSDRA